MLSATLPSRAHSQSQDCRVLKKSSKDLKYKNINPQFSRQTAVGSDPAGIGCSVPHGDFVDMGFA